jgi:alpha-D-xyloside xylohydrolase
MHGDSPREPWHFGEEAVEIVRRYVKLRFQLFPYLYSTAHEAARVGLPVIRALALAFPDDPGGYREDLEYMLGAYLLVAPIYDSSNQRQVYFPPGEWVDYWTKSRYRGPAYRLINAPLDTLPLFVRAGAVIPMMSDQQRIPEDLVDPLILEVYPAEKIACTLLEDDGTTEFSGTFENQIFTFGWSGGPPRARHLRFVGLGTVRNINLQTTSGVRTPVADWRMDSNHILEIRLPHSGDAQVIIELAEV